MANAGIVGFDPLSVKTDDGGLDEGIAQDAVRREVLNILKSYTGYFDIFSELIQNGLDALDHRIANEAFDPKLWIDIDISKNRVRVVDNGIGMGVAEARFCFRPNVSFKQRKVSRGHKGVGATFIAYGFNVVRLFTKRNNALISAQLRSGRQWAEDDTHSFSRPHFESSTMQAEELFAEHSGTAVEVLIGEKQRPQLNWLQATNASQWLDILRMKTPLGGVYLSGTSRKASPTVYLSVVDLSGTTTRLESTSTEYYFPHELPNLRKVATVKELETAINTIKGDPTTRLQRLPDHLRRLEGIYESPSGKSCIPCDASDEEHDGCGVEEGSSGVDGRLDVLGEASVAVDPGEEALDHPSSRQHDEADLIGDAADDLDGDRRCFCDALSGVAAVGEELLDEGVE